MPRVTIARHILAPNESIAKEIQLLLGERRLHMLNIMSSPGAGKTTLLERSIALLQKRLSIGRARSASNAPRTLHPMPTYIAV